MDTSLSNLFCIVTQLYEESLCLWRHQAYNRKITYIFLSTCPCKRFN